MKNIFVVTNNVFVINLLKKNIYIWHWEADKVTRQVDDAWQRTVDSAQTRAYSKCPPEI